MPGSPKYLRQKMCAALDYSVAASGSISSSLGPGSLSNGGLSDWLDSSPCPCLALRAASKIRP